MGHVFKLFINIINVIVKVIIFLTSFLLQFFILYLSIFSFPHYFTPAIYAFSLLIALFPVVHIYNSSNNSSYKMSWLILIFALPITGTILYIFFGQGRNFSKRKVKKLKEYRDEYEKKYMNKYLKFDDPVDQKLARLLQNGANMPMFADSDVTFIKDGREWFDLLLEDIKNAKEYIFMEYFILSDGYALKTLSDLLIKKAKEGVIIKIILDDIGSKKNLKQKTINALNAEDNIEVVSFNPMGLVFSLNLNFRNHRKITVVDGNVAYCGGTNIADEYIHEEEKFGYWRDNACKYTGITVNSFVYLFCQDWFISSKEKLDMSLYFKKEYEPTKESSGNYICSFGDGPGSDFNPGYTLFRTLIENAKESIYISTPYFIIDRDFITTLENTAMSGIDVRLIIPHIPDKKIIFDMTYYHVGRLIKSGVKVYRYLPGFTHAKNVIVDGKYSFNGTINFDYRSLFLHFECGSLHINKDLAKEMTNDFVNTIKESQLVEYDVWKKRSIFVRIIEFIGSLFAPLL